MLKRVETKATDSALVKRSLLEDFSSVGVAKKSKAVTIIRRSGSELMMLCGVSWFFEIIWFVEF